AHAEGLERVSVLVKSQAIKGIVNGRKSEDERTILVPVKNYRELAGYAEQKRFGSLASFCTFAMEQHMQRNQLTEAQKLRIEKSIE
ncbi:MAG: hypothetical protein P1P59_10625, partial [Treponemataceae bacterium]